MMKGGYLLNGLFKERFNFFLYIKIKFFGKMERLLIEKCFRDFFRALVDAKNVKQN